MLRYECQPDDLHRKREIKKESKAEAPPIIRYCMFEAIRIMAPLLHILQGRLISQIKILMRMSLFVRGYTANLQKFHHPLELVLLMFQIPKSTQDLVAIMLHIQVDLILSLVLLITPRHQRCV